MIADEKKQMNLIHELFRELYDGSPDARILCAESRLGELLDGTTFGNGSTIHRLKVVKGVVYREDIECARLVEDESRDGELQVFFLKPFMRNAIALSPTSFFQLLKATKAPPSYFEVLMNNNGVYNSYVVRGSDSVPKDYYLFVKYPFGPFANGSFMLHHCFPSGKTSAIVEVTNAQFLAETIFQTLSSSDSGGTPSASTLHPFTPFALFVNHLRCLNEDERQDIDKAICHLESRSGVALHTFGSRSRARISEFALLKKELHMKEALMAMANHVFSFQARMIDFAVKECEAFSALVPRSSTRLSSHAVTRQMDFVTASLVQNGSMATWTLEQLQALGKRLRVQAKVVDGTITATDTLTMIRLAQNSQSDSSTMKAITVLTMVFLPATFVCSLFGMGFFDFETSPNESKLRIADQFWIYFVVTIPLTVVVLGTCAAWLKWSGRERDSIGDFPVK
ncbi:hypothetical protein LTR84_011429 [Exophiala bonariae]|uniref:Uncharacterized protein n=1 Tax=Exophiala bonariae TaxID=1690606 RepID=A0AAV9MRR3_9EURO|nr:hypothetical protein LTR84_011429 [Exophiala bonariae]